MLSKNYNEESIKQLKGAERVRIRPGVMFGSDNLKGAFHTVKEIVGNSLDEARASHGDVVEIVVYADGSISVKDHGRGVPMGFNKSEQRYNWDLIFNELYAGGKYDSNGDNYKFSIGLNGLGAAAVQYTSEFFKVISRREDKVYAMNFAKGYPVGELVEGVNTEGSTGTFVHWKIDNEVFPDTKFSFKMFKDYCESQAHINEITFILYNEETGERIEYKGEGLENYLRSQINGDIVDVLRKKSQSNGVESGKNYSSEVEIVLAITEECASKQMFFHNTSVMTVGMHQVAFEDAVNRFFSSIGKKHGVQIVPYDYKDYLSVLVSTYSNITSFANQTKDGVSNQFIYSLIYETVKDILEEGVVKGKQSIVALIDSVVSAALARKKAKEIEAQERLIRKTTNKRVKAEKYVDCKESNPSRRELFIVEGDSAKGACKNARDGRFQALLPTKGKPINCLKASLDDILNNKEIQDIISTVGTGVDVGDSKSGLFDISNLQFDKIIIATDGDIDGFQIRVLLYTVFYKLMPQLLRDGHVYIAETPLFELETTRGSLFAYSVEEKDELLKKCLVDKVVVKRVNRSKGLGENDPDMLWNTTMNPATRRLVRLDIDIRDQIVRDVTNMLFGVDPDNGRKQFIFSILESGLQDLVETVENLNLIEEAV